MTPGYVSTDVEIKISWSQVRLVFIHSGIILGSLCWVFRKCGIRGWGVEGRWSFRVVYMQLFLCHVVPFFPSTRRVSQSQDVWPQRAPHMGVVGPDWVQR